jgi:hypothetical protein
MKTIEEIKAQIKDVEDKKQGVAYLPSLTFAGRIGTKIHVGRVYLDIQNDRLVMVCARVGCGSAKWNGRTPSPSGLSGQVAVTCKKCGEEIVNLDERNAEYLEVIKLIGKKV